MYVIHYKKSGKQQTKILTLKMSFVSYMHHQAEVPLWSAVFFFCFFFFLFCFPFFVTAA